MERRESGESSVVASLHSLSWSHAFGEVAFTFQSYSKQLKNQNLIFQNNKSPCPW